MKMIQETKYISSILAINEGLYASDLLDLWRKLRSQTRVKVT